MQSSEFKTDFEIEKGNIRLKSVDKFIKCEICGQNLALVSDDKVLIKTFSTLLDVKNSVATVKCGKCKQYNSIDIASVKDKATKCLLVV